MLVAGQGGAEPDPLLLPPLQTGVRDRTTLVHSRLDNDNDMSIKVGEGCKSKVTSEDSCRGRGRGRGGGGAGAD